MRNLFYKRSDLLLPVEDFFYLIRSRSVETVLDGLEYFQRGIFEDVLQDFGAQV